LSRARGRRGWLFSTGGFSGTRSSGISLITLLTGCCGLTGSGSFVGQGIYAGSNRVIGGQVGQHQKGMVAINHPSLASRPELEDVARINNQYY